MNPPDEEEGSVTIGVVLRPHGIKGEVVVEPLTDNEDRFGSLDEVRLVRPSGSASRFRIASLFPHKGRLVIQFEGVSSIEGAEGLRGAELRIPIDTLPKLPAGSYYHHELRGLVQVTQGKEASEFIVGIVPPCCKSTPPQPSPATRKGGSNGLASLRAYRCGTQIV